MADWTYQIIDQSGKERKGNIVAESEAEAKNKLKMDGNMVISLTKATALTKEISFSVGGKVKPRDLSVFCLFLSPDVRLAGGRMLGDVAESGIWLKGTASSKLCR